MNLNSGGENKSLDRILEEKFPNPEDRKKAKEILEIAFSPEEEKRLLETGVEKIKQDPEQYEKVIEAVNKLVAKWEKGASS